MLALTPAAANNFFSGGSVANPILIGNPTVLGTQTLTNANTCSGATTVNFGTVALSGAGSILNSAVSRWSILPPIGPLTLFAFEHSRQIQMRDV